MSGLAGQKIGVDEQSPTPIGGNVAIDPESRGSMESFIGFGLDATSYDPAPEDFDAADDTVTAASDGTTRVAPSYTDNQLSWGGSVNPPSDGILFDTARGDSFVTAFDYPVLPELVVSSTEIVFNSATAVNANLQFKYGGVVAPMCFDKFTISAETSIEANWSAGDQNGFYVGFFNEVTSQFGGMIQSHPTGGQYPLPKTIVNNTEWDTSSGATLGAPMPANYTVRLDGNNLDATLILNGNTQVFPTIEMSYPSGSMEMPHMFSTFNHKFSAGHFKTTSLKIEVGYPNARYAFIGDSITQGRFATVYADAFVQLVRADYPTDVICCGAPSSTIEDWNGNIAIVGELNPKYALVMLGMNNTLTDTAAEMKTAYDAVMSEVVAQGMLPIALAVTPANRANIQEFNALIQASYPRFVDCNTPLLGVGIELAAAYDSGDGVHPNSAGHAVIANTIVSAITSNGWN